MTEVPGHVIDPNGDARRALQEAVAEHGPEALSNAVIMYNVCRDYLIGLPGESILIGSAARSDVPALLRSLIPRLGNYGAIQAAAATLAEEHELDVAACLWVVREFARALGHIAPGPATGGSGSFLGPGPRPGSGRAPRPVPGPIPVQAADSEELTAQVAVFPAAPAPPASGPAPPASGPAPPASAPAPPASGPAEPPAAAVTGEGGGAGEGAVTGAEEAEAAGKAGPASDTPGSTVVERAVSGASGSAAAASEGAGSEGSGSTVIVSALAGGAGDEGGVTRSGAPEDGGAGGEGSPSGTAEGSRAEGSGVGESGASAGEAAAMGAAASGAAEGGRAVSESFASSGTGSSSPGNGSPGGGASGGSTPGGASPGGSTPGPRNPAESGPGGSGAWGGPPPGGGVPWGGPGGGGAGLPGGPGLPPRGPGGPGVPPPGGPQGPPGRQPERSRVFSRNTLGVAAAIALVAGYLGVAAVAHLSPFPAKTVAATSPQSPGTATSAGTSAGTSTSASPNGSPAASPDASPTSDYQILLTKIPSAVRGQDNCRNAGTGFGATAVSQCSGLHGPAAGTVLVYYLYPSPAAVTTGFSSLLKKANFSKRRECTANDRFVDFLVDCESGFTDTTPNVTGTIAEYTNTTNQPVIVSSASQQNVMAVMVGTNDGDLLAYWKQLTWIVS